MARLDIPPQENWLYQDEWSAEMDNTFLNSLVIQKNQANWVSGQIPDEALQAARLAVHHYHGLLLTWDSVVNRKRQMEERFRTFNACIEDYGCDWDMPNNTVIATESLWRKVFKKHPFAQAYKYSGDPEIHNLKKLFGANEEPNVPVRTVVNISSTIRPSVRTHSTIVLSDDEDVTSQVPIDRFSAINGDPASVQNFQGIDPCAPPSIAPPPRYGSSQASTRSKKGDSSSCASSNPYSWYWK